MGRAPQAQGEARGVARPETSAGAPSGIRWFIAPGPHGMDMTAGRGRVDRIVVDPKVMLGKPVIRGTRVTVAILLEKLAAGLSMAQLLEDYPRLTREDIRAALEYASHAVGIEEIRPLRV